MTGVAVPSYYNPAAVNPVKYAEQLKKRKMLWSKAPKETADKEKEVEMDYSHSTAGMHNLFAAKGRKLKARRVENSGGFWEGQRAPSLPTSC